MKAFVLGCGYLGYRVARRWIDCGHHVAALTRSTTKAAELRSSRIDPLVGDITDAASLDELPPADVVLYSVAYDRNSETDRHAVLIGGLRNALNALRKKCDRLIFVSTTSVYGQSNGEWVDESSTTRPDSTAGRLALEAEAIVEASHLANRCVILRLSGLYGPGRLLRRTEQLRRGEPIAGEPDAWLNLVHVEDAARAVVRAAEWCDSDRSGLFLVTDDQPVRRREYYGRLAELTGSPPPVFDQSQSARSPGLGKRCRNDAAKASLGMTLRFPTYEDGLADSLK